MRNIRHYIGLLLGFAALFFLSTACNSTANNVALNGEPFSETLTPIFITEPLEFNVTDTATDVPVVNPTEDFTVDTTDATATLLTSNSTVTSIEFAQPAAIILFIGDGMGYAHRNAAKWYLAGQDGLLVMDSLAVQGSSKTASANSSVTDSAAGGTALASGQKTRNGVIGMDVNYNPVPTILEQAQDFGWSIGLISDVQVTHATPASFAAHVASRDNMLEIASQMIDQKVDVLMGGGEDEFLPITETGCYPERGERGDGVNLVIEAQASGYTYVCTADQMAALDPGNTSSLLGLFADEEMVAPVRPSLAEMTRKAIEILSQNPEGFFLMVEAGQIDWEAHDNNAEGVIQMVTQLDAAVAVAQVYALQNPNVLLIVTADHETGGMDVSLTPTGRFNEDGPFEMPNGTQFFVEWTHGSHSGEDVPVSAMGPWSELLVGVYENTHIYQVMYLALTGGE